MKQVTFEARYFANNDEWEYFLSQLDIKDDKEDKYIDEITLSVDSSDIKIGYTDL